MKCSSCLLNETAMCEDKRGCAAVGKDAFSAAHTLECSSIMWEKREQINWSKSQSGLVCIALGVSAAGYQYLSDVKGCENGWMAQLSV